MCFVLILAFEKQIIVFFFWTGDSFLKLAQHSVKCFNEFLVKKNFFWSREMYEKTKTKTKKPKGVLALYFIRIFPFYAAFMIYFSCMAESITVSPIGMILMTKCFNEVMCKCNVVPFLYGSVSFIHNAKSCLILMFCNTNDRCRIHIDDVLIWENQEIKV